MSAGAAPRVLLVDDDLVVLSIYGRGLTKRGLQVETATDGLAAIRAIHQSRPDVVVLDLMMPKFSGVEVLKFVRGEKQLNNLPVVVLSNAYMSDLARDAAAMGAQKALLKVGCNPQMLSDAIREVLEGTPQVLEPSRLVATPELNSPAEAPPRPAPQNCALPVSAPPASLNVKQRPEQRDDDKELQAQVKAEFLKNAPFIRADLRRLFEGFKRAPEGKPAAFALESFYRKLHFITATAGLAGRTRLAELASAFEAMLYQMMDQPARITASVLRTSDLAIGFLDELLAEPDSGQQPPVGSVRVLLIDHDPLSSRLVITALRQAGLQAQSTPDPAEALDWLKQRHYDLILLDTGFTVFRGTAFQLLLRQLPGHEHTPIIYVSELPGIESRSSSFSPTGEDLISKPVFPTELALKVVMHFLKTAGEQKAPPRP